jgi:hypothetical protein
MANKKPFINPLTRSSEEDLHVTSPQKDANVDTAPPDKSSPSPRKHGNKAFEQRHERFTAWIDKQLKRQLDHLARTKEVSKTSLFNEAIADLIRKYTPTK